MSADGKWTITLNTPMGAQPGALDLKTNGDSLEGTMGGPQGDVALERFAESGREPPDEAPELGRLECRNVCWATRGQLPVLSGSRRARGH